MFIPLYDINPLRTIKKPIVTRMLIIVTVIIFFLFESGLVVDAQMASVGLFAVIPAEFHFGAGLQSELAVIPEPLTLVTYMFLHGGWMHLIGNMLFLWIFGDNVEDSMGHIKYLIFYLLGGIAAAAAQVALNPDSTIPMIGASGAIAAVMAAYLVNFPRAMIRVLVFLGFFVTIAMVPAIIMIGLWFVLQIFSGLASLGVPTEETGGIAFWAHIGGFVAGLLLVWIFRNPVAVQRQRAAQQTWRA